MKQVRKRHLKYNSSYKNKKYITNKTIMHICKEFLGTKAYTPDTGMSVYGRGEEYGLEGVKRKKNKRGDFHGPVLVIYHE